MHTLVLTTINLQTKSEMSSFTHFHTFQRYNRCHKIYKWVTRSHGLNHASTGEVCHSKGNTNNT